MKKKYGVNSPAFLKFLGVSKKELENYSYAEYEDVPGIKSRGLIRSMGGTVRFPGHPMQDYMWRFQVVEPSENLLPGEFFIGYGKTRNEAALAALCMIWEMWDRRFKGVSA